ncbi:TonB-dependent receptor plug domain-containing protein [Lutibacter sp.]
MQKYKYFFAFLFFLNSIIAQKDTVKLKEVIITSNRIEVNFSQKSRTITVLTAADIAVSSASNVSDLLQEVAGVDIRRRGINGMQSDLYIRGGNFNQTLILIDGIKMDDAQTGHHTMNAMIPLENIAQIEIIKGPAARVYGQNAFTGAINIVTKKVVKNNGTLQVGYGSFNTRRGAVSFERKIKSGSVFTSFNYQDSDGYRFNTDFENSTNFTKIAINRTTLTSFFTQRKFGANGFYASPEYKDQYEETQTSLVAISQKYKGENVTVKPRLYWRRNQDMYLFLRNNPSYYRNLHISNKIGAESNVLIQTKMGEIGAGVDFSNVFLASNNLGNHKRTVVTGFLEYKMHLLDEKLDITPGVAINYYSDFGTNAFPGIDVGYVVTENFKLYGNIGYTYRVPTFTDLYYVGPTTIGNPNLEPESALSEEIGANIYLNKLKVNIALFNRKSDNLIDWTKENEADKWQTKNFSSVSTRGIETEIDYAFKMLNFTQKVKIGYNFLDDKINDTNVQFTRYSLNSIKHQLSLNFRSQLLPRLTQSIVYKYVQRTQGESYNVVDAKITTVLAKKWRLSLTANNIFNAVYTETNLVPMPKGHVLIGLKYMAKY